MVKLDVTIDEAAQRLNRPEQLADALSDHLQRQTVTPETGVELGPLLTGAVPLLGSQQHLRFVGAETAGSNVRTAPLSTTTSGGTSRLVSTRQLWCRPSPTACSKRP